MPIQTLTVAAVAGQSVPAAVLGMSVVPRALYLYENDGIYARTAAVGSDERALYLYENDAIYARTAAVGSNERGLYLYENDAIPALVVLHRDLYTYEATRDLPVVPWLMKLDPMQQYPAGTVDLYGDGLGQYAEVAAGSTISASSTNGGNIPGNVGVRTSATNYWQSNDGATAWIRFTFAGPLTLYAVALEDIPNASANQWGVPLFRFSDGGADVTGGSGVPIPTSPYRTTEYPVATQRTLYVLPALRTVTWVEVRVASGGAGTARGLSQAWVYADEGQSAETSNPILNALSMGVAGTWINRSPGLWPANGGVPITKAVTVVVPVLGTSGLVKVQES